MALAPQDQQGSVVAVAARRRARCAAAVGAAVCLTLLGAAWAAPAHANLLTGRPWFVDYQRQPVARQVCLWQDTQPAKAARLSIIAAQPVLPWFGNWQPDAAATIRFWLRRVDHDPFDTPLECGHRPFRVAALEQARQAFIARVRASGHAPLPMFAIKAFSERSSPCGRYDGGGRAVARFYRRWIRGLSRGIGRHRAVMVLEPDALGLLHCLNRPGRAMRLALMRYAVKVLTARRGRILYIDAGAGNWRPWRTMARLLRGAGVRRARGFALNVTHKNWTSSEIRYGRRISHALGGKHFVINTVMNGNGPLVPRNVVRDGREDWCNPPGRRLGAAPTTQTADPLVDAYLWIGQPAMSSGPCHGGPPRGTFWPEWALELTGWPPDGTGPR